MFVVQRATGKIGPGIYQKTGRKGRGALKALFVLKPSVRIQPELAFIATAKRVATEQWPAIFDSALQQALRTAR